MCDIISQACYDMDYPEEKLTVYVCDDGGSRDMRAMVARAARTYRGRIKTVYVARVKTPGVPHHAKAGNLNNAILDAGSNGQLIIVLDCDMLPEPSMARTVAPFFFKRRAAAGGAGGGARAADHRQLRGPAADAAGAH
jgi:cellulose synthase/poly-beta-1,6-N-acetylglucosamine synthase-like glycosyltransferase